MNKNAQSDLLTISIITAIVIAIGLFLFGILSGYSGIYRYESLEEVNSEALVLRSSISADYVFHGDAYIRNIGKEPVVIFRLIVLNNGTPVWDSGVREIATLDLGELRKISYQCPLCRDIDPIVLQVHYTPRELYDPSNPELINPTSDVLLFKVASFPVESVSLGLTGYCSVPLNWVWIDFVDPVEEGRHGELSGKIKLRLSKASKLEDIMVNVMIRDSEGREAEGSKILPSMSNVDEIIELKSEKELNYPAEVFLNIVDANWTLIQNRWYFGADRTAYIDLVKLLWNSFNYRLVEVFTKAYHIDNGTYKVDVKIYDCFDRVIASGFAVKEVGLGAGTGIWEEYSISLNSNPLISDVYRVEVDIVDISPLVTETQTITETITETTTLTLTSTSTIPSTTLVTTSTSTSTITRWTTVATTTHTSTITRTITTFPTTVTTTRMVTVTSPTATRTITSTITSTVSRTIATTRITSTITHTSTETTNTITATTTIGSTTTKSTTVTTTVTVTRAAAMSIGQDIGFVHILSFLIIFPIMYVYRRWRR